MGKTKLISSPAVERRRAYGKKLLDPRWKLCADRIKARDNWTCLSCGRQGGSVEAHHVEYLKGREPWEYADEYLATMCRSCHAAEGKPRERLELRLLSALRLKGIPADVLGAFVEMVERSKGGRLRGGDVDGAVLAERLALALKREEEQREAEQKYKRERDEMWERAQQRREAAARGEVVETRNPFSSKGPLGKAVKAAKAAKP